MIQWHRYFFHLDFSAIADQLKELKPGTVLEASNAQFLLDELNTIDDGDATNEWVFGEDALDWNLHGAEVVYNGPNSYDLPTKGTMGQVLVLKLMESVMTPQGIIYLTYNTES